MLILISIFNCCCYRNALNFCIKIISCVLAKLTDCMHANSLQLCLTPETPWAVAHQCPLSMGIPQARILEWIAVPSSRGSS